MRKYILVLLLVLLPTFSFAATYYVGPSGSATWGTTSGQCGNSTNGIDNPCSLTTAFANAGSSGPDLVYLEDGTYSIAYSDARTRYNGSGSSDALRVIFKNATGAYPNINVTGSDRVGVLVQHSYWTFDGLSIHYSSVGTEGGVIGNYQTSPTGVTIKNCHIHLTGATTFDNVDAVYFEGVNYGLIQFNDIEGYTLTQTGGIMVTKGIGCKVLNNAIHHFAIGIYNKWANNDSSFSTGAEVAYNYVYDVGPSNDGCLIGRWAYTNIHDNIFSNSGGRAFRPGSEGGGPASSHALVNHNTFLGSFYTDAEGLPDGTITNNIFMNTLEYYATIGTWDYNIYGSHAAIGAHDQGNTSVTFVGGSTPSTISGFALATGSNGENDGDDSKDLGADVTLVGINAGGTTPPSKVMGVSGSSVESYMGIPAGNIDWP